MPPVTLGRLLYMKYFIENQNQEWMVMVFYNTPYYSFFGQPVTLTLATRYEWTKYPLAAFSFNDRETAENHMNKYVQSKFGGELKVTEHLFIDMP